MKELFQEHVLANINCLTFSTALQGPAHPQEPSSRPGAGQGQGGVPHQHPQPALLLLRRHPRQRAAGADRDAHHLAEGAQQTGKGAAEAEPALGRREVSLSVFILKSPRQKLAYRKLCVVYRAVLKCTLLPHRKPQIPPLWNFLVFPFVRPLSLPFRHTVRNLRKEGRRRPCFTLCDGLEKKKGEI